MKGVTMPGFSAETSLERTRRQYRGKGVHGSPRAGAVVPQLPVCSPCTNSILGTRVCCDVKVGQGPDGDPVISVGACTTEFCGVLADIFGNILTLPSRL